MMSNILQICPLTPAQQGMLFYWLENPSTSQYFEQFAIEVEGELDCHKLERCYQRLVDKYDIFRTVFVCDRVSMPVQVVLAQRSAVLKTDDYADMDEERARRACEHFLDEDRKNSFDLRKDILLRLSLLRLPRGRHLIIWSFHHIVMDGWSFGNVVKEFLAFYDNESITSLTAPPQFEAYIKWCEKRSKTSAVKALKKYLSGFENPTPLLGLKNDPIDAELIREQSRSLPKAIVDALQQFCIRYNVTLYNSIAAVILRLLQIYNQSESAVIGNVVSGRRHEIDGIYEMAGMLINSLPLRGNFVEGKTFVDLMHEVGEGINLLESNSYCPLAELQNQANNGNAFFDCVIAFENYPFEETFVSMMNNTGHLPFKVLNTFFFEHTNYHFYLSIFPSSEDITFRARFNEAVYAAEDVAGFLKHIERTLTILAQNGDFKLSDLILIDPEEEVTLDAFNDTDFVYDKLDFAFRKLERAAREFADETAVICGRDSQSYMQLNNRSNAVAKRLAEEGLLPGEAVGVMMNRTVDLPAALFGIMKAGGAYVPLQPSLPTDRLDMMIQDSAIRIVITNTNLNNMSDYNLRFIEIRGLNDESENPSLMITKTDPAYILYTSGTTGIPKGVVVSHGALNNFIIAMENEIDFTSYHAILSPTSYTFDIFGLEMYLSVSAKLKIVLADDDERLNPLMLASLIEDNGVDVVQMTPTGISMLLSKNGEDSALRHVRCILIGGEAVSMGLLSALKSNSSARIYNVYGPTETTIWSTISELTTKENVDIGRPIANTQVYILGSILERLPINVPGELFIAGDGVANGYLNRADLNDKMFLPNLYGKGKMYKTGDIVKLNRKMELEFIGRRDGQVKIRGYRIECEEVASTMTSYSQIVSAAVIGLKDSRGTDILAGYYVSDETIDIKQLKRFMSAKLPEYMIPNMFCKIDEIPLTASGKLNRKLLPAVTLGDGATYMPAGNNAEKALVDIWKRVLSQKRISITDNFFEIGGHSLLATYLIAEIGKQMNVQLNVRDVFLYPTVEKMAQLLERNRPAPMEIPKVEDGKDEYAVSASQKRIYLMSVASDEAASWHMLTCVKINRDFDLEKLGEACNRMCHRHEILRTTFHAKTTEITQRIHAKAVFQVDILDATDDCDSAIEEYASKQFDLDRLFLFRVGVLKADRTTFLIVDMHHIISDGLSLKNFLTELISLYMGQPINNEPTQYKDFVYFQRELVQSEGYKNRLAFWRDLLCDVRDTAYVKPDFRRENRKTYAGDAVSYTFSPEEFEKITERVNESDMTLFMFLSTALAVTVSLFSGNPNVILGTPVSGRIHSAFLDSQGVFINTIPLFFQIKREDTIAKLLHNTRELIMNCFDNQDASFEDIVECLGQKPEPGRNPLFDITCIMQNTAVSDVGNNIEGISKYEPKIKTTNSDLLFENEMIDGALRTTLQYALALYIESTAQNLLHAFVKTVNYMAAEPGRVVGAIQLFESGESDFMDELSIDLSLNI